MLSPSHRRWRSAWMLALVAALAGCPAAVSEPAVPPVQAEPAPPEPEPWRVVPAGDALRLIGPRESVEVRLVAVASVGGRSTKRAPVAAWELRDGALVGSAELPGATFEVAIRGGEPLELALTATSTQAGPVGLLAVDVHLAALSGAGAGAAAGAVPVEAGGRSPGAAPTDASTPLHALPFRVLDRAYRWVEPDGAIDVGSATPQVAVVGPLTLHARAAGLRASRDRDGRPALRVVLDQAERHPLALFSRCADRADDLPTKVDRSARVAAPGDAVQAVLRVAPHTNLPLPGRFAAPFRAAIAFTDHADQSDAVRLGALMYGRATRADPLVGRGEGRGFAGRGLSMTKTVFPLPARGYPPQLDDPAYVAVLDAAYADGIAIGPHSASGVTDPAERTAEGLAILKNYEPRTWIDHQPNTNCEAVVNRGLLDGPHDIRPALRAEGYRYVWAGTDLPETGASLNLLLPDEPAAIRPFVHPHPLLPAEVWIFQSQWRSWARDRFVRAYADEPLDALTAEHGLHIAHTYLDAHRPTGPTAPWTLLEPADGGLALRPEADAVFARLAERQQRGEIQVASLERIADHLRAALGVELLPRAGGLSIRAAAPIDGLTLFVPDGTREVTLGDGTPLPLDGSRLVLPTLPAGERILRFDPPLGPSVSWTIEPLAPTLQRSGSTPAPEPP